METSQQQETAVTEALLQTERRLRLARLKAELREVTSSTESVSAEQIDGQSRMNFQKLLLEQISDRLNELNVSPPSYLVAVIHDWVRTHWDVSLRDVNLTYGIPLTYINSALKALLEQEHEAEENREEARELNNNSTKKQSFLSSFAPALKNGPEIRIQRRQHRIQRLFAEASVIFTAAAAGFMFCMLLIGCADLFRAVYQGSLRVVQHVETEQHEFLLTSLGALEVILVAPLPYLLILSLNRYIKALAYQERTDEFRRELLEFKAFEVALFIAIIAATSVSDILDHHFDLKVALPTIAIIGILAIYYFIIERACRESGETTMGNRK
ncbi:hypothetical protein [Caballeronia sp. ATUFL_M2_KS44]|uniref:hypothetical protein n=1 Tax=Caballeronia sp. ATUFL_M2_KS44 TaxID=2921767 RepID=UPI002028F9AC|nr:hypothetical protein [Caballeronia sp. ATUFL_M2_KS44]